MGRHYSQERFRSERAAGRDLQLVEGAIKSLESLPAQARILDVPSGTGRLEPLLTRADWRYVGADLSLAMLREAGGSQHIRASAWQLPFASSTFDLVVCCRLLHHVSDAQLRRGLLRELLRVSKGPLIASFWDSASLHSWRRRHGLRRARHEDSRIAVDRLELQEDLASLGAVVVSYHHSLRFISQQAFFCARKEA